MNPWLNMQGVASRTNSGWASGGASIGGATALPPGFSFRPMTSANVPRPPRNPFARQEFMPQNQEEENPFGPEPARRGYDENGYRYSDGRKKIMGYSQSQGAQRTRTGPLSPRTSYTPTSMLPRSQRYSR